MSSVVFVATPLKRAGLSVSERAYGLYLPSKYLRNPAPRRRPWSVRLDLPGIRKIRNSYLTIFLLINGVWLIFFSVFYLLFFEPEFTWAIDDIANVVFVIAIYGEI